MEKQQQQQQQQQQQKMQEEEEKENLLNNKQQKTTQREAAAAGRPNHNRLDRRGSNQAWISTLSVVDGRARAVKAQRSRGRRIQDPTKVSDKTCSTISFITFSLLLLFECYGYSLPIQK
jgi:hypothetical protein